MSVTVKNYKEGKTTSATDLNADYTAIATESGNVTTDSIRTGGINRVHLAPTESFGPALTWWDVQTEASGATKTYNNTSYALIDHGTDMQIAVGETLHEGDTLRIQANVFMTDGVLDSLSTDAAEFSFAFYWDIGTGYGIINSLEFRYSYSCRDPDVAAESVYKNRRMGFSFIYIHTGADISVTGLQCRVKVTDALNSVTLREDNMFAIIHRH
jgi:hypothetical protein